MAGFLITLPLGLLIYMRVVGPAGSIREKAARLLVDA